MDSSSVRSDSLDLKTHNTTRDHMQPILYSPDYNAKRWVAYFDFLGTKKLIETGEHRKIFSIYTEAMEEVKTRNKTLKCVEHAWFSDTFIFYTDDESISSWGELEHLGRWFFIFLSKLRFRQEEQFLWVSFTQTRKIACSLGRH